MFAYLTGTLVSCEPTHVILDVRGVGYEVRVSLNTFEALQTGQEVKLFVHFHVKEDAQTLYGFLADEDKQFFRELIGVSGIGPSTALAMFSSLTTAELKEAIAGEDVKTVQRVKGIGAKTAQRVVLELRDKLRKAGFGQGQSFAERLKSPGHPQEEEALMALTTLGLTKAMAQKSLVKVLKAHGNEMPVEQLIKLALQQQ